MSLIRSEAYQAWRFVVELKPSLQTLVLLLQRGRLRTWKTDLLPLYCRENRIASGRHNFLSYLNSIRDAGIVTDRRSKPISPNYHPCALIVLTWYTKRRSSGRECEGYFSFRRFHFTNVFLQGLHG
jgi:hypothetical protein